MARTGLGVQYNNKAAVFERDSRRVLVGDEHKRIACIFLALQTFVKQCSAAPAKQHGMSAAPARLPATSVLRFQLLRCASLSSQTENLAETRTIIWPQS